MHYLKCPSTGEDRVEVARQTIDEWLRSLELAEVVESFDGKIPEHLATKALGEWLLDFSEQWDFRKHQAAAKAKDTQEHARWLVDDSSLSAKQREVALRTARELGLIGIETPQNSAYDYMMVLGGARLSCLLRPKLAAQVVSQLAQPPKEVVLLASGRPIADSEREATDTYAPNAKTEFDLINQGAEQMFHLHSTFQEERHDDPQQPNQSWIIRRYQGGAIPITSYLAPSSEPEVRRANSADTYEFFFARNNVAAGANLLLVTSQIYVPYQQLEAIRTVALQHDVVVETIGFPAKWAGKLQGMATASNYLQEIRSTIQAANRFLQHYM